MGRSYWYFFEKYMFIDIVLKSVCCGYNRDPFDGNCWRCCVNKKMNIGAVFLKAQFGYRFLLRLPVFIECKAL